MNKEHKDLIKTIIALIVILLALPFIFRGLFVYMDWFSSVVFK